MLEDEFFPCAWSSPPSVEACAALSSSSLVSCSSSGVASGGIRGCLLSWSSEFRHLRSACGFHGWRRRRFASLWSLVAACWCLASSGSSQFVCGSGMGCHPSNQNGGSGCGPLRPSLFSNNLFNIVFVSRERVSAQCGFGFVSSGGLSGSRSVYSIWVAVRWVYTVSVECKGGGNIWRKLLNDGIVVSRLLLVPSVVSIFWPFYGFVFRFSARVRYGFSLEAVGTIAFRV
ncbi:hypothetical protein IGI04_035582 [Brassica rapa subsp. trilocularis]|uniref:Transmembrane protein n=1 Tax=Brassica rapa subsp. trilocularis TaxID=1813537 RepID=A0ABQ7LBZ4_BRACM|nr:hypothetical protein IGI04_035582 [Brassica rapa subsp. trilocularis]